MENDSLVEEVYSMIMDVLTKDQVDLLAVKIMLDKVNEVDAGETDKKKDSELGDVNIVKKNVYGIPLDACYQSMMTIIESSLGNEELEE